MRNTLSLLTLGLIVPTMSSGCALFGGIEGIWMVFLTPNAETACTESLSHNFTDASSPDVVVDEGDWTYDESNEISDQFLFAQIIKNRGGTATMIVNDSAYIGTEKEGGVWNFNWTGFNNSYDSETHTDGYNYTESTDSTSQVDWNITFDGNTFTGTASGSSDTTNEWTESDDWDFREVGLANGQIPAALYLTVLDQFDNETPASNSSEDEDCDSEPCYLSYNQVCSTSQSISGEWTGYGEEAPYVGLEDAGQPAGAAL